MLLWARQLKVYCHPTLNHLRTKRFPFGSWIVLIGIIGSFIGTFVSYLINYTLIASTQGCVIGFSLVDDELKKNLDRVAGTMFLIMLVFQIYLLAMFAYPFIIHFGVCECCFSNALQRKNQQKVRELIIRLSICSSLSVFSDGITLGVVCFFYDPEKPVMFWYCMYTLNVIFSIVSVVRSFSDWKQRLVPCLKITKTAGKPGGKSITSNLRV